MREVPAFLAKYELDSEQLTEVLQRIRERLFVAEDGAPRILGYSGHGALGGWLRMVAVRVAVDFLRRGVREPEPETLGVLEIDPELALVKARYAEEFKAAMQYAIAQLSDREATLLQLRYSQNMEASAIAAVYQVSSRTVQRWLGEAHDTMGRQARKFLMRDQRLSERDVQSLLRVVRSELDITLGTLLRRSEP